MMRRVIVGIAACVGVAALGVPTIAHAQTSEFASFVLRSGTFDSTGTKLTATDVPVFFFFRDQDPVRALLNFSADLGPDLNNDEQIFSGQLSNMDFQFTSGTSNLLSTTDSTGLFRFTGGSGTTSGSVSSGNTVNFKSDFIDFSNSPIQDFSFSFSGVNPAINANGPASFRADGATGTFATGVPEPGTFALIGAAALPVAGLLRARRRK